jgi:hypothetical protein
MEGIVSQLPREQHGESPFSNTLSDNIIVS